MPAVSQSESFSAALHRIVSFPNRQVLHHFLRFESSHPRSLINDILTADILDIEMWAVMLFLQSCLTNGCDQSVAFGLSLFISRSRCDGWRPFLCWNAGILSDVSDGAVSGVLIECMMT